MQKFEKNIPELIEVYTRKKEKVGTEIYEGVKGLKTILEDFLKTAKDEWLVLGGPKKAELLGGFFKDLNQRRAKKKVKLKIVYNKDAKGLIDIRKKQPLTEVRIMPDNFVTPASIEIVGNKCAIVLYSPVIIAFGINSKEVADSFRQYFELIWKSSERI